MNSHIEKLDTLISSIKDRKVRLEFIKVRNDMRQELRQNLPEKKRIIAQRKREDIQRRKESKRHLRQLMKTRGYWTKEADRRHKQQHEEENPIVLTHVSRNELIKKYKINNLYSKTIEEFLTTIRSKVLDKLSINHKVIYTLTLTLRKDDIDSTGRRVKLATDHHLVHRAIALIDIDDIRESYDGLTEHYNRRLEELETMGSGWTLDSIDYLEIKTIVYRPMRGGCISNKLPEKLEGIRSIIRIKTNDDRCLQWAIMCLHTKPPREKGESNKGHEKEGRRV